jgi:hypothetical protein
MPDTRRQLLGQKVGSRFHHSTYIHYPQLYDTPQDFTATGQSPWNIVGSRLRPRRLDYPLGWVVSPPDARGFCHVFQYWIWY